MNTDYKVLFCDYMALVEKYNQLSSIYEETLATDYKLEVENNSLKQENINLHAEITALKLNKLNEFKIATPEHLYEIEHGVEDRKLLVKALEDRDITIDYLNKQIGSLEELLVEDEFKPRKDISAPVPINIYRSVEAEDNIDIIDTWSSMTIYDGSDYEEEENYWNSERVPDSP